MSDNGSGICIEVKDFSVWYAKNQALKSATFDVPKNCIYAFIGPSGCGKTTMLRSMNRLNDLIEGAKTDGIIKINGLDIYSKNNNKFVENLRRGIGMVFQQPNPLPTTIMHNMLLPVKEHYSAHETIFKDMAIKNLTMAALYDEVAEKIDNPALSLSGGQQQRLCIARALMLKPYLILFDEPCSSLDPISTFKIEDLLLKLKESFTIVMVTHNMEQARRIADYTAFFLQRGNHRIRRDSQNVQFPGNRTTGQIYLRQILTAPVSSTNCYVGVPAFYLSLQLKTLSCKP